MDEAECLKKMEEKLKDPSATIDMSEDRDPEELQEVICESISTQESLKQYNLELQDIVAQTFEIKTALHSMASSDQLTSEILHESNKLMDLEVQLEKKEAEILHELKKLMDPEIQLEEAGGLREPHVDEHTTEAADLGELPGSCVEFAAVEEIQVHMVYLEEEEHELSLEDVQTKSWWRRQAERLWKGIKCAGNFCLGALCCLGLRRCLRQVVRSNQVLPL